MKEELDILNQVAQVIFNKKGINILALDMRPCSSLIDYVLIAEGLAPRHVIAIAESILEKMKKRGIAPTFQEGLIYGDWVVLDFSWLVVHIFMPGFRDRYQLEYLWSQAEIVDVVIDLGTDCLVL
jgi:ribosome-associated protein